jgi:hypothetical protein
MRHRFHSICPYFAMFPESFVEKHLIWSKPGDLVLDPFSGRGTTVFQSLLSDRQALGGDTNQVAVCISRAKADPPKLDAVLDRLTELERGFRGGPKASFGPEEREFFDLCFAQDTLTQVLYLRDRLDWRSRRTDRMIAALALGCLHGESHRSPWVFSNRMPRTISTKPAYSVRWWQERRCYPPKRDVFSILRSVAGYRYESELPVRRGRVAAVDVRRIAGAFADCKRKVSLVITSPPYLDTTNYREDQWLRLWFLGGASQPERRENTDDRHRRAEDYWAFLREAWKGIGPLLKDGAHLVVRIGGKRLENETTEWDLKASLREGLGASVRLRGRSTSLIRNGQVQAFRPGAGGIRVEYDYHFQIA